MMKSAQEYIKEEIASLKKDRAEKVKELEELLRRDIITRTLIGAYETQIKNMEVHLEEIRNKDNEDAQLRRVFGSDGVQPSGEQDIDPGPGDSNDAEQSG